MRRLKQQAFGWLSFKQSIFLALLVVAAFTGVYSYNVYASGTCYSGTKYGRTCYQGYFTNIHDGYGDSVLPVISNGQALPSSTINSADSLYGLLRSYYLSGTTQEKTGAAFIYNTMMANDGPEASKTISDAQWEELHTRLKALDDAGKISWSGNVSDTINSYYQGTGRGDNPADDALYEDYKDEPGIAIHDYNGNVTYKILRRCANPIGYTKEPPPPPPGWSLEGDSSVDDASVNPGQRVTFTHHVTNIGPDTSDDFQTYLQWTTGYGSTQGDMGYEPHSKLKKGGSITRTVTFVIPTWASPNTQYCQRIRFYHSSSKSNSGWGYSTPACVKVQDTRTTCPSLPYPKQNVYLPYSHSQSSVPTYGDWGDTYTEYHSMGYTVDHPVSTANDISSGGQSLTISIRDYGNRSVMIDYTPFTTNYPYDYNQGQVTYTNRYYTNTYTATGAREQRHDWFCDSYGYRTHYDWEGNPYSSYECVASHYGPWYTVGYDYVYRGRQNNLTSTETVNGQLMRPCYDRNFKINSGSSSVTLSPTREDPNAAYFYPGTSVTFSLDNGPAPRPLRKPAQVKLSYNLNYWVDNASWPSTQISPTSYNQSNQTLGPISLGPQTSDTTTSASPSLNQSTSVSNPQAGDKICFIYKFSSKAGTVDPDGKITSSAGPLNGPDTCSEPIYNEPYFSVYGNDVGTNGGVSGYGMQGSGNRARGAAVQLAIIALQQVNGVASASLRTSTPTSERGLTFANTTGGTYGGYFGASMDVPDYWSTKPSDATRKNVSYLQLNPSETNNTYYVTPPGGTLTLSLNGGGLHDGNHLAVYVAGNVYLPSNMTFQQETWGSVKNIPSLYIITTGNIYIGNNVTQLDGIYIAGPNRGGYITTCTSSSNGATPSRSSWYNTCNRQLTVNGAFITNTIKMQRTYASLRNSQVGELATNPANYFDCTVANPSGSGRSYSCAAEVFRFSPEAYLSQPAINPSHLNNGGTYDYITSLPPVL